MRTLLIAVAVAGTLMAAAGLLFSVTWLVLTGTATIVVALVTGALAAPMMRRHR